MLSSSHPHHHPLGVGVVVEEDDGGVGLAARDLVEDAGGVVAGCAFVIELAFLEGRERLADYDVRSLVVYESE